MRNVKILLMTVAAGVLLAACSSTMADDGMHGDKTAMSDSKMSGDTMSDSKMSDSKMSSDKMAGDKMAMSGDSAMPMGLMVTNSSMGKVLSDKMDMTLYTYDMDAPGVSNCYGNCAKNWPPLMASKDAKPTGDFSVVTRKDGTMQWALKGMPLYTWVKDTKPGDVTGDGVGGVWHAAMAPGDKMMK